MGKPNKSKKKSDKIKKIFHSINEYMEEPPQEHIFFFKIGTGILILWLFIDLYIF